MTRTKKYLLRAGKFVDGFLNATILQMSKLSRRRADHWLFGHGGDTFGGNSKYLFLWMTLKRPDMRAIWVTDDEKTRRLLLSNGLPAYRRWSYQGIRAALRSRVFVYCHDITNTHVHLSGGACLVNLWHGVGLKPTMFGDKTGVMSLYQKYAGSLAGRLMFYQYLVRPDMLVTTSTFMQRHFTSQFELPAQRVPVLGYPRLDCMFDEELKALALKMDTMEGFAFDRTEFSEVYIYMPTWRDSRRSFLDEALPDLDALSRALAARNAILYVKLHPLTSFSLPIRHKNIVRWPDEVDFYTYLDRFDALITDYSSVLYDYLFVKKTGAVLYVYDYDDWVSEDRGLLYPFEENTAGLRIMNFESLCQAIVDGRIVQEAEAAGQERVREKFWGGSYTPASPAIIAHVEQTIGR